MSFQHNRQILLLLSLLVLISLVVYWDFLSLGELYLYKDIGSDTLNFYYPSYVHIANYLRADGVPIWSFSQGMGQNIFPGELADPFNLILFAIGPEYLAYGLVYVQVCKVVAAGILFFLYLRLLSLAPTAATVGALLYAFSAFTILGGTWYIFSTQAVYFALLLYGFERYLQDRTWAYFVLGIALVAAGMTFYLYVFALFFLPYSVLRHHALYGWPSKRLSPFLLSLAGLAVLGVGISAVFVFAHLQTMMNSPRVLGDASYFGWLLNNSPLSFGSSEHNITAVMRLFSSDLLGTGSDFRGWGNYLEAPMFYCGLLPLLLAPQVLVQQNRNRRIAYALFGLILLAPVIWPFFRHLFWAFTGDYYRLYSIFAGFVFLLCGLLALNDVLRTGRVHIILLLGTLALLLLALFSPNLFDLEAIAESVSGSTRLIIVGLLIAYATLVIALKSDGLRSGAKWALLVLVCVELTGFSWRSVNARPVVTAAEFAEKTGYRDYTLDALAAIRQRDAGFYRIEKTYSSGPAIHTSFNDALVQGYFGTNSYHSFNQLNYIRFLDALEVIDGTNEVLTRWATGILNHPVLTSFASVKYVLAKQPQSVQDRRQQGYELVLQVGDVHILMNSNYLPFGFTYDRYMPEKEFMALTRSQKNVALMKTAALDRDPGATAANPLSLFDVGEIGSVYGVESFLADIEQRRRAVLDITHFSHNHVKGEISLDQPGILFLTIPFDRGWQVTVNGNPETLTRVNVGFSGVVLPAGQHVVEFRYELPYFKTSLIVSILALIGLLGLAWRTRIMDSVGVSP